MRNPVNQVAATATKTAEMMPKNHFISECFDLQLFACPARSLWLPRLRRTAHHGLCTESTSGPERRSRYRRCKTWHIEEERCLASGVDDRASENSDHYPAGRRLRGLVMLRDRWPNPPEWVEWEPESVAGYPERAVPRDEAAAALEGRTLTSKVPGRNGSSMPMQSWMQLSRLPTAGRRTSLRPKRCESCWPSTWRVDRGRHRPQWAHQTWRFRTK